ncbi:hypothetical protein NC653_020826 [Populus alba x Populus x berolinensis]|uniref:Uncharacterized protein n=1 Tax=Populus alba x Populus x berolinensis TaxID=444605 RepID=A0AAD6MN88_9ROSI|nr:hypothetical protein NC653_020826 [Populus alba x Populus x berolinensis]
MKFQVTANHDYLGNCMIKLQDHWISARRNPDGHGTSNGEHPQPTETEMLIGIILRSEYPSRQQQSSMGRSEKSMSLYERPIACSGTR